MIDNKKNIFFLPPLKVDASFFAPLNFAEKFSRRACRTYRARWAEEAGRILSTRKYVHLLDKNNAVIAVE